MGAVLSTCCPPRQDSVEEIPMTPVQLRRPSVLDPQTFEFVDALRLPKEVAERPKRGSVFKTWFSGGVFSSRASRSEGWPASKPVKMLMSGTGESGKSTIIKQMKIIHQGGFTQEELNDFRPQIYRNIHDSMLQILVTMEPEELSRDERTLEAVWVVRRFKPVFEEITGLPSEYVMAINYLWLEVIRNSFDSVLRKSYILDSAPYFFDEVDRIAQSGFVPSNDDVLRARITTTGINEYTFKSGPLNINMIDVGGQRPERRKWIETFDNVTTLIFCVAISEYDHMLREEPRQNRLLESFQLWESVVNSKWFQRSSVVLFLNKKDIFRHKLRTNPLPRYFPEYRPPDSFLSEEASYEHAAEFIKNKFLAMNYGRVQIYPYLTCATDTKNIDLVFAAVKETVLANNLRSAGIL